MVYWSLAIAMLDRVERRRRRCGVSPDAPKYIRRLCRVAHAASLFPAIQYALISDKHMQHVVRVLLHASACSLVASDASLVVIITVGVAGKSDVVVPQEGSRSCSCERRLTRMGTSTTTPERPPTPHQGVVWRQPPWATFGSTPSLQPAVSDYHLRQLSGPLSL